MNSHRSRAFWPAPLGRREPRPHPEDDKGKPYHSHRQPRLLWVIVFVCIIVLGMICGLLMAYSVRVDGRLAALEEYVEGRGEARDREAARAEAESKERNRQLACDMADKFPEGGGLDRLREAYGCGPGIPISELPPEEQKDIAERRRSDVAPAPAPALPEELSPFGTPIIPDTSGRAPRSENTQPSQPSPEAEPSPEPAPPSDRGKITDLVCGVVAACP